VRILLDENLPVDLAADPAGQQADTVAGVGWAGVANGELLRRAAGHFDAFLTMDRNLEHQQNLPGLPFGVLVLRAPSNRLIHLRPLIPDILDALKSLVPGQVRVIGR
jgi:hypothetical protein